MNFRAQIAALWIMGLSVCPAFAASGEPPLDPGAMILTLELPDPDTQRTPYPFFVSPDDGILIEFPAPVMRLQGRGFRIIRAEQDSGEVRSEWVAVPHAVPEKITDLADIPGPYTLWVNPQFDVTMRVLHVTLGDGKVYSFQFCTPPKVDKSKDKNGQASQTPIAYARVRFVPFDASRHQPKPSPVEVASSQAQADGAASSSGSAPAQVSAVDPSIAEQAVASRLTRTETAPEPTLREMTPEVERGMLDYIRMLGALPLPQARAAAVKNPVFETVELGGPEDLNVFGATHRIQILWVVRDTTSGAIGLGVVLENNTNEKLTFDMASWALRVGHGAIYRATSASPLGSHVLEPKSKAYVQFVVARDAQDRPLKVDVAKNIFTPSVRLEARSPAKPIQSIPVQLPE